VRTAYTVPTLDSHVDLQQKGVPGLLTVKGFQTAYTDYQQHMIDELNESTAGMPLDAIKRTTSLTPTGG
jgi:Fe-Mn family superoxide dismutase